MNNDQFFTIVNLMASTKYRYYQDSRVKLFFSDAMVTFERWVGDSTRMQVKISSASNEFTCCIAEIFQAWYRDETLNIAGIDINGKEYRNTVYVGYPLLNHEISLDELLEDE